MAPWSDSLNPQTLGGREPTVLMGDAYCGLHQQIESKYFNDVRVNSQLSE